MDGPARIRPAAINSIMDLEAQRAPSPVLHALANHLWPHLVSAARTRTTEPQSNIRSLHAQQPAAALLWPQSRLPPPPPPPPAPAPPLLPLLQSSLSPPTDTSISSNASLLSTIPDADPEEEAREGLQPLSPPLQPGLDARILALALSRSKAATKHMLGSLHRMEGVTAFSAKELSGETLLGIRIDTQSRRGSTFGKPVYVLLEHRAIGNATTWVVARHSVPAWIGIIELARAFLPPPPLAATPPPTMKGGGAVARQSVESFVKAVRGRVVGKKVR